MKNYSCDSCDSCSKKSRVKNPCEIRVRSVCVKKSEIRVNKIRGTNLFLSSAVSIHFRSIVCVFPVMFVTMAIPLS